MENHKQINQETPHINSEHVREDFYKWFESRGLLTELKAHMRQLMVKALQDSGQNGKSLRPRRASASPKLQAVNLLIVDYLFHEDYLYTVSVFASEAQILDSLPQYSCYVAQTVRGDPCSLPRFSRQQAEDILDTLRLPPSPSQVRETLQMYLAGGEPLLTCVVRTLAATPCLWQAQECDQEEEEGSQQLTQQLWSQQMKNLLLQGGVKMQHIHRMQLKWAQMMEEERQRARQEAETEVEQRVREEMQAEQQLLTEQRSRVELRERGLAELAGQLTAVHEDITDRMTQMQEQRQELEVWETRQQEDRVRLQESISQLRLREQHLEDNFQDLAQPVAAAQKAVQVASTVDVGSGTDILPTKQTLVQTEAGVGVAVHTQTVSQVQTQTRSTVDQPTQTALDSCPDPHLMTQLQADRERINELQEESLELRAHILQQRQRIDELTNRAADLASQLEDSRLAVSVLSGRNSVITPRAPQPPVFVPQFGFNSPQRQGAGEESMFVLRPQQVAASPGERRRPQRFAFSQNRSPTSEESNTTDEVVRMARARIQQLEQESSTIQRHYQAFQSRLFTTDSVMFPPLGSPRLHDPLWRVRQSEATSFAPFSHPYRTNIVRHPTRSRATQVHADNEESSSDALNDVNVDNFTNSRRIFSHRNIRQFERWKQFKKKFQRHAPDHTHSKKVITSSEDEERDVSSVRRREAGRRNNVVGSQNVTSVSQKQSELEKKTTESRQKTPELRQKTPESSKNSLNKIYTQTKNNTVEIPPNSPGEETNMQENFNCDSHTLKEKVRNSLKSKSEVSNVVDESDHEERLQLGIERHETLIERDSFNINDVPRKSNAEEDNTKRSKGKSDASIVHQSEQEKKLRLGMERSEKLIESVKILLGEKMQLTPTPSNGSLAVESLPRDSDVSYNEVPQTENSSALTVQSVRPVDKPQDKANEECPVNTTARGEWTSDSPRILPKTSSIEVITVDVTKELSSNSKEVEIDRDKQDNPSLVVPPTQLVSTGPNSTGEENVAAICPSDVAEQECATPSVTSGSDILRELNPSRSETSESALSVGLSRHSDQFWD